MDSTPHEILELTVEERAVLTELLESERARLLVEIRHTAHRSFRDELRTRLAVLEHLIQSCRVC